MLQLLPQALLVKGSTEYSWLCDTFMNMYLRLTDIVALYCLVHRKIIMVKLLDYCPFHVREEIGIQVPSPKLLQSVDSFQQVGNRYTIMLKTKEYIEEQ